MKFMKNNLVEIDMLLFEFLNYNKKLISNNIVRINLLPVKIRLL
jgi:hypothetical protein